ncbi:GOLPH3/VPS74 family protein [Phaeacidiphilus oryzae]|uniref:GOLPH3/VPS74 family protein n=1 Tax=Phaeacidiphilus oryzae TaxID=348818 RepID=UPI000563C847|nr:GPP34 family phosphoprotein [Phaeacidiphilus oryzae]
MSRSERTLSGLSLPDRLYLLARRRGSDFALVLRAAALTDLLQRGLVEDRDGCPAPTGAAAPASLDPYLARVLESLADSRGRSWRRWVGRARGRESRTVRDALAERGVIELEERRFLGLIPYLSPTPADESVVEALRAQAAATLEGSSEEAGALLALAAAGDVRSILPGRERRAHKARLAELTAAAGPAVPALRAALRSRRAARASSGG